MINECNEIRSDSIISVKENKSSFKINNKSRIKINKVEVDGCLIDSGSKCDYLFEVLDYSKVFYVELKGKDIGHALEQIESTIKYCKDIHKDFTKKCYIVASRVPKESTKTQILKKKFIKNYNIIPNISTNKKEITI